MKECVGLPTSTQKCRNISAVFGMLAQMQNIAQKDRLQFFGYWREVNRGNIPCYRICCFKKNIRSYIYHDQTERNTLDCQCFVGIKRTGH